MSLIIWRYSSVSHRDQCLVRACLFSTQKTLMTFSSVKEDTVICSLTTCRVTAADDLTTFPKLSRLKSCIIDIHAWCDAKRLQLSADKTGLLWFSPAAQLRRLPSHNNSVNVNQCVVKPVTSFETGTCGLTPSYQCARTFLNGTDMFLPSVPNMCRSTTARPLHYSKTSYSTCPVASGLLQCRAG